LGHREWRIRCRVQLHGVNLKVLGLWLRVLVSVLRAQGLARVLGLNSRVQGFRNEDLRNYR
jgi:hypothetical protein